MQKLRYSLLAHQKRGVAKCFKREDAYGIVFLWADPGLGKTLHLLAVATAKRRETLDVKMPCPKALLSSSNTSVAPVVAGRSAEDDENNSNSREKTEVEQILESVRESTRRSESAPATHTKEHNEDYILNSRATLVVCPKSSLNLWKKEIAKHVVGSAMLVVTLQTSGEDVDLSVLSHADFVLITYDLLLSAFRKVPGSDVDLERAQWTERHRSPFDETVDYDVESQQALEPILSLKDAIDCSSIALLYALRFERVVFDEAHNVRTLASKKYRACVRLCARYRWAMTGSALQNEDIEETYCAFKLLHVPKLPSFAVWRSSLAPAKSVSRKRARHRAFERREKQRYAQIVTQNNHTFVRADANTDDVVPVATSALAPSNLNDLFANASANFHASAFAKDVIERMAIICKVEDIDADEDEVFRALMPRGFPDCVERIVRGHFRNEEERQFYLSFRDQLNRTTSRMVKKKKKGVTLSEGEASTKTLDGKSEEASLSAERVLACSVMRLRQAAIAGALVMSRRLRLLEDEKPEQKAPSAASTQRQRDATAISERNNEGGGNEAEKSDEQEEEDSGDETDLTTDRPAEFVLSREKTPWAFERSTKMLMFRNYVRHTCVDQSSKVLVFSHFLGSLDLCGNILDELGVRFVRVDGSVDSQTRHDHIARFQREDTLLVFLIIVKAMGESVDGLQVNCNRVLFLDPWFNPEVEQQALRRVLRMGQRQRKVFVTRLVVQGTFEERVVNIAASKSNLLARVCSGNLGQIDGCAMRRWTAGDVRDRLLYDEEGFVLQPTIQTDGEQDKEQEFTTTTAAPQKRRAVVSTSTADASSSASSSRIVTSSTSDPSSLVSASSPSLESQPAQPSLSFYMFRDTDDSLAEEDYDGPNGDKEGKDEAPISKRRRRTDPDSAALLSRKLTEFEDWCDTSLFFVQRVPTTFFGSGPLLFKRAHVCYDTLRSAVFFSDTHGTLMSSRAKRFYRECRLQWTFSGEHLSVWSAGFKLHLVSESILVSFIEQERTVTNHHDPHRLGLLNNLITALRQHRDSSTKLWARAEPTFPPFEAFCALVPDYEKACADSFVHGWLWDNQTDTSDVPFVVLYKPQRFAIQCE